MLKMDFKWVGGELGQEGWWLQSPRWEMMVVP